MPQPTPYTRLFSFTDYQAAHPSDPVPGYRIDEQLDGVATTLSGVLGNLRLIQRDDGMLKDGCVTVDSFSPELLDAIAGDDGLDGVSPPNPNFTVVTSTLAPGAAATAVLSGVYPNLTLTLGVPRGLPAVAGSVVLSDGVYGDITISSGGTIFTLTGTAGLTAALNTKQAVHANLTSLSGLVYANKAVVTMTAAGTFALTLVNNNAGSILDRAAGDSIYSPLGHTHAIADVVGLTANLASVQAQIDTHTAAIAGKQPAGSYATTGQLALKADALTVVNHFNTDEAVSNTWNGVYNIFVDATPRTATFGGGPSTGFAAIVVNRATVNLTISCPGGYYKNGGAIATTNLTVVPGGKLTAFHEGGGVWAFDGTGF